MSQHYSQDDLRRVVDAALQALLEQPGSGALVVQGRELRFALRDLIAETRDALITACVPLLLTRAGGEVDAYLLNLDGLLLASDRRPEKVVDVALSLIADRYPGPNGRRQRSLLWSDIRERG